MTVYCVSVDLAISTIHGTLEGATAEAERLAALHGAERVWGSSFCSFFARAREDGTTVEVAPVEVAD